MKRLLTTFILCAGLSFCAVSAHAEHWRYGGGRYYYHPNYGWAVPAFVGGAIVYEATRPPVYIQSSPTTVYIQQPNPPALPAYPAPAGYHWEALVEAGCNCYRTVLVAN